MKSMKVLLAFYSKTGNTEKLANKISKSLSSVQGVEIAIHKVVPPQDYKLPYLNPRALKDALSKEGTPDIEGVDVSEFDLVIVAAPTWFERPAPPIIGFVEKSRGYEGKKAVAITTSISARSVYAKRLAEKLRERGFDVVGWYSLKKSDLPEEVADELKKLVSSEKAG